MTIGAIPPVAPVVPAPRMATLEQEAAEKLQAEPSPRAPFEPAPALRPTIQDKIEIDRALMALRAL